MTVKSKRTYIALSLIGLLVVAGTPYAYSQSISKPETVAQVVKTTTVANSPLAKLDTSDLTSVTNEVSEVQAVDTTTTTSTSSNTQTVRGIYEIAADYSNLIGNRLLDACFKDIIANHPDKFTPEIRERNLKILSRVFGNSCGAIMGGYGGTSEAKHGGSKVIDLVGDMGDGDIFQRFAGLAD